MDNNHVDISGLSIEELWGLREEIGSRIGHLQEEAARKAFEQMEQVAAGVGMSLKELVEKFGPKTRTKPRKNNIVRYRNPQNPEETWSGRGRKPNWIDRELQGGGKLEDYAVAG